MERLRTSLIRGEDLPVFRYKTQVSEEQARKLRVKDELFLTGKIFTARDQAHLRALDYVKNKQSLPVNIEGMPLFHCGPLVKKVGRKWRIISAGPTTSSRLENVESQFLEVFKPRIIIGKGGMGQQTSKALQKVGAVYCSLTGGAAVLSADAIEKVEKVIWLDLGVPEALWILSVTNFGPLIVTMDSIGNDLYEEIKKKIEVNRKKIYQQIIDFSAKYELII